MANFTSELNGLDFDLYISGPMQAAITAQTKAALSQVAFIKSVGFKEEINPNGKKDLQYVDFSYQKAIIGNDGVSANKEFKLSVPLLTIVSIPSIRIDEMTIDFSVKLESCETENNSTLLGLSSGLGLRWGGFVNFKASASYRKSSSSGSEVNRTYNLAVHVKVVNDEIPAGLERVLSILENEIKEVPANSN